MQKVFCRLGVLLSLWVAIAPSVSAQQLEVCTQDMTVHDCLDELTQRYKDAARLKDVARVVGQELDDLVEQLRLMPTGLPLGGLSSTVIDTLPAFSISGLNRNGRDEGPDTGFTYAPRPLSDPDSTIGSSLWRLEADQDPAVSPLVRRSLEAADQSAFNDTLESRLSDTDDLVLAWDSVSHGGSLSRDVRDYQGVLSAALFTAYTRSPKEGAILVSLQSRLNALAADGSCSARPNGEQSLSRWNSEVDCLRGILAVLDDIAEQVAAVDIAQDREFETTGIHHMAALAANSGQFSYGVAHHARDKLVGADFTTVHLTFEFGFPSMTQFQWTNDGACEDTASQEGLLTCGEAYREYIQAHSDSRGELNDSFRLRLALEYAQLDVEDIELDLPVGSGNTPATALDPLLAATGLISSDNNTLSIRLPEVERYSARLGFGWMFMPPDPDSTFKRSARLDGIAEFRTFSSNPLYHDAWRVGLTLSFDVGGITVPLQIIHQGKSEFEVAGVDGADTEISVGIAYKLIP